MEIEGSCLCGGIKFVVRGPFPGITQCHCSLCRKCSGAAAIAKVVVPSSQIRSRISGEDLVASYERPSGYGNTFCKTCGCPAPVAVRKRTKYAIPAGLLANSPELKVAEHIFVGSKAHWDIIGGDATSFDTM